MQLKVQEKKAYYLTITAFFVLLFPALFINLGLMPLISDEPTRGIVTLEMLTTGNFITLTINGVFYYNKPPLFNWILASFVQISGLTNEFIFRLPTVLSLLAFTGLIYFFAKNFISKQAAITAAIMFITSSRILFWDSFQGLIDITYSLITFSSFVLLFYYEQKGNHLKMFVFTYALTAFGFLMKGMPSPLFQAISLLAWLLLQRKFKLLFTWKHLAGIAVFAIITGAYLILYLRSNSVSQLLFTLFEQSNRLSKTGEGTEQWLMHLLTFPFELGYEFAPWLIFVLLLLNPAIRKHLLVNNGIKYSLFIFIFNLVPYWLSADMRPRYLFMLIPLLFVVLAQAIELTSMSTRKIWIWFQPVLVLAMLTGSLSLILYIFWSETRLMPMVIPVCIFLSIAGLTISIVNRKSPFNTIAGLAVVMLLVRIGFGTYNLPARYNSYPDAGYREGEIEAGKLVSGNPVYILGDTPFNHDASFYITRETRHVVSRPLSEPGKGNFYIADAKNLANFAAKNRNFRMLHSFTIKLDETKLYLIKVTE